MLNDDDHSSVELALRFVDAGKALAFGGYDVLNGYFGSVRLENRALVGVFASGNQVAENEKVGDFSGRNQAHEIEIEVGPSGGGHVVVVVELRVGPVEVVLPDAASHDRRFGRPLIREGHAGLQTSRPMRGTEGNCFAAHPCRNESRPAVAHFVRDLRDRVHIRRHFAVLRRLSELLLVERNVMICADRRVLRRPFLHLVRAGIHRLDELPLKPALRAVGSEAALRGADSRDGAPHRSQRAIARRARFLVVYTEVGVVREEIELVAEALDHAAGEIARIRQSVIVEGLVGEGEWTVLRLERR